MIRRVLPALFLSLAVSGTGAEPPATLTTDVPAAGVTQLSFIGAAGEADIGVSPDDAVHVKLELEQQKASFLWVFRWLRDDTARDIAGAKLGTAVQGGTLSLYMTYPNGATHNDVKEKWTVQVPARFRVDAAMDAGRLVIRGLGGGVTAQLQAGELSIHVPGGPLKASVRTGRVHAISDSVQPGKLSVDASFGLAALSFGGKVYAPPPASFHFFGNSEARDAGGKDDMELKVFAGEADLRIGPVGENKDYPGLFDDEK